MAGNHLTKVGRLLNFFLFCLLLLGSSCDAESQRTRRYQCSSGYFGMNCLRCECSGVTHDCQSTKIAYESISTLNSNWRLAHFDGSVTLDESFFYEGVLGFGSAPESTDYISAAYWRAPSTYSGNRLSSYGANLTYSVDWRLWRGDVAIYRIDAPTVVLISTHGLRIAYCAVMMNDPRNEQEHAVPLMEAAGWHHIHHRADDNSQDSRTYIGSKVTRSEMLKVLANLKHLMIRSFYAKGQMESYLTRVSFPIGKSSTTGVESLVEQCHCPEGYSGLSCESCDYGYMKILNDPFNSTSSHRCISDDSN